MKVKCIQPVNLDRYMLCLYTLILIKHCVVSMSIWIEISADPPRGNVDANDSCSDLCSYTPLPSKDVYVLISLYERHHPRPQFHPFPPNLFLQPLITNARDSLMKIYIDLFTAASFSSHISPISICDHVQPRDTHGGVRQAILSRQYRAPILALYARVSNDPA